MSTQFSLAVLISGGGTTLKNLIDWRSQNKLRAKIDLVISSSPTAGGLKFAESSEIPNKTIVRREFEDTSSFSEAIFEQCRAANIDLVVMGGFLKRVKIPDDFENRVINIHPSLIPSFCGKGNYGIRVHQNVIEYGAKLSGCTVHFVDDQYDHGPIIAQATVPVLSADTPDALAARVFEKECELYPQIVNAIADGTVNIDGRKVAIDQLN
jgi:phosphoribosylglycinamide formyltransferase-1